MPFCNTCLSLSQNVFFNISSINFYLYVTFSFADSNTAVFEARCNVTGYPSPSVSWYFNNISITSHSRAVLSDFAGIAGARLLIYDLSQDDFGLYTCEADNGDVTGPVSWDFMLDEHGNTHMCRGHNTFRIHRYKYIVFHHFRYLYANIQLDDSKSTSMYEWHVVISQ